jgi:glycine/D-amino acid oxidase-like deaminating enzyme
MLQKNPTSSYWLKNIHFKDSWTKRADIVVVGAGISGASVCYHLSKLDPTKVVVMIDPRGIAGGATGRNGGLLWPSLPDRWSTLVEKYGIDNTRKFLEFSMKNVEEIKELVGQIPSDASNHPKLSKFPLGAIHLMETEKEYNDWKREIEEMKRHGGCLDIEMWDKNTLEQHLKTTRSYFGAVHDKEA